MIETIADVEDLALNDTDEYQRKLTGYFNLLGGGAPTDLTLASIPTTMHEDHRYYNVGLERLSTMMAPIRPGELVVVGAREGCGKSAFGEMFALRNTLEHKLLYATLEMTREEVRDRLLAKCMQQPVPAVLFGREEDTPQYRFGNSVLNSHEGLYVWHPTEKKERTVHALTQRAQDVSADLLLIDYGREITGWEAGKAAAEIVDYLGHFVRRTRISIILLAQLNRDAALKRPHNGHLQDTGRLEQKADRVLLLHRPYLGLPRKDRVVEIIVTKNRQGPCFRWHAHWEPGAMNFFDMSPEEELNLTCCRK